MNTSLNIFCPCCGIPVYGGNTLVRHLKDWHGVSHEAGNLLVDEIYKNLDGEMNQKPPCDSKSLGEQNMANKIVFEQISDANDAHMDEANIQYRVVRLVGVTRPLIGAVLNESEVRAHTHRPGFSIEIIPAKKKK